MDNTLSPLDLSLPFRVVLVGGSERSGTTILYALLCTATNGNDFVREPGYHQTLLQGLVTGLTSFESYTGAFFGQDLAAYRAMMARIIADSLTTMWEGLGRPDTLVLKSPRYSMLFGVLAPLLPEVRFVVSVRQPEDIVISRLKVIARMKGWPAISATPARVQSFAAKINDYYTYPDLDNILSVRIEDLSTGDMSDTLMGFTGLQDVSYARLAERDSIKAQPSDPWYSESYAKGLHKVAADYGVVKVPGWTAIVDGETQAYKKRFGYGQVGI